MSCQEKLLLDFPLIAPSKGTDICRACLLSHLLFYLLTIPAAHLLSSCSSVFLLRNVKQQEHLVHRSDFSVMDKELLKPGILFTA